MDEYASRVLEKHWPHVKRYPDIRDVVRPEPVDLICGGFPCQDVSLAGKRAGLEGKRSTLWSEMFRLVCEVRPRWVVAENVPGLLSSDGGRFFGGILRDLAAGGYDAEWGVLSAATLGAPHRRQRIFIVANPGRSGESGISHDETDRRSGSLLGKETEILQGRHAQEDVANPNSKRRESSAKKWWATEPNLGRVAHGVPSRVDRLKCLGNAVVPQVAQVIGEMILKSEKGEPK